MGGLRKVKHIPIEELRVVPVTVLARRYDCDEATVHRQRHRKGVVFQGSRVKPPGRPPAFDWSALDPSKDITENMLLTGCPNREYVGVRLRQLRKSLTL